MIRLQRGWASLTAGLAVAVLLCAPAATATAAPGAKAKHTCDPLDTRSCLLPWPNNHFTFPTSQTRTGLVLNLLGYLMPKNKDGVPIDPAALNRSDGFSPGSTILTSVKGLDLRRSQAVTSTNMERYADPKAPLVVIDAVSGRRKMIWAEIDPATGLLQIHPGANLAEQHRFIVALRDLKDRRGKPIKAGRAFRVLRDRLPTTNPRLISRRHAFERTFKILKKAGIERRSLYLAWTFTVASRENISERAAGIRDAAFAKLGDTELLDHTVAGVSPTFQIDQVDALDPCGTQGCQDGQDARIARRVAGTLTVPCYLDRSGCPPGAVFKRTPTDAFEFIPKKTPYNTIKVAFTCVIPRAALTTPGRALLFGHDVMGSEREVLRDDVEALAQEHDFVACATRELGMSEEDAPLWNAAMADLSKLSPIADRVQQGFLDFMFLGRAMIHPKGLQADAAFQTAAGKSVFAPDLLFYDGTGQGALFGGALTALAPDYDRAAFTEPAMNLSFILPRSTAYSPFTAILNSAYPDPLLRTMALNVMQPVLDRAETNGYARRMTQTPFLNSPLHDILLQANVGDHRFPQMSAETIARTVEAVAFRPAYERGRSRDVVSLVGVAPAGGSNIHNSGLSIWDSGPVRDSGLLGTPITPVGPVVPRAGNDPHGLIEATPAARAQISDFLNPAAADTLNNRSKVAGEFRDVCAAPSGLKPVARACRTASYPY